MDYQQNAYYTNLLNEDITNEVNIESLDDGSQPSEISSQIDSSAKKARGGNFTNDEDNLLISAWLNTTLDAVRGNEQKSRAYWLRVWEYFHKYKTFESSRNQGSLMNRWSTIQHATNKFNGCFAQIVRLNQSGTTEIDKIRDAKKLYKDLYKTQFPFEHCWNELRGQPKWMQECDIKKQKKTKTTSPISSSPCAQDSINTEDGGALPNDCVELERPLGRKLEKNRNKRKNKDRGNESFGEDSPVMELLKAIKEEKIKTNEKKMEMFERSYAQEQERLAQEKEKIAQEKEKMRMEQLKEEQRIMSMDLSVMPPLQAEYFRHCQMEIMKQRN